MGEHESERANEKGRDPIFDFETQSSESSVSVVVVAAVIVVVVIVDVVVVVAVVVVIVDVVVAVAPINGFSGQTARGGKKISYSLFPLD